MRTTVTDSWDFTGSLDAAYADCKRRVEAQPLLYWRNVDVWIDPLIKSFNGETVTWSVRIRYETSR